VLKLLFSPIRLATGWGISPRILGWIGVCTLVLLRVTIGWHFFSEGIDKYRAGNWSAAPFFANAKGPFASHYRGMVWDAEGTLRLDRDRLLTEWARFRDQVTSHYGFDDAQTREAQRNFASAADQYDYVMELNQNEVEEFQLGRERIEQLDQDATRSGVSSLGGQRETIRKERQALIRPVLAQIDSISESYERCQTALAKAKQREGIPAKIMRLPPTNVMDTSIMDEVVPYFDMAIGWCLILGLFTPAASLAAAGFLGSVFLSQYPPTTGPSSSMYQLIEGLACLVLAGTAAGRFAGLDFFIHLITRKVARPQGAVSK